jgi:hypothetical protein
MLILREECLLMPKYYFESKSIVVIREAFSISYHVREDRLYGLVVRVPGYKSRVPGSMPGTIRFFLRSSGSGTGSTQPREDN